MDIDSLFNSALADVKKRALAQAKPREQAKVIAKLRPHAVSPIRKLKEPLIHSQVVFYTITTCRCSFTTMHAEYSGQTFIKRKLDKNDTQWDYIPKARFTGNLSSIPRMAEHRYVHVEHCPNCIQDLSYLEDDFLQRAFAIAPKYSTSQDVLNFDEWAYPASLYPLMVI